MRSRFIRCALLSEEKILRCQRAMRTLNNAGAVELTIYLVKMPVRRRRDRFCQNPSRGRRFRSDFLNIWRCSFAFNASHLLVPPPPPRKGTVDFLGTKVQTEREYLRGDAIRNHRLTSEVVKKARRRRKTIKRIPSKDARLKANPFARVRYRH